jgi:hypothetical protein
MKRLFLLVICLAAGARAEAQGVSVAADVSGTNTYVWRGSYVIDKPILVGTATASGKGLRGVVTGITSDGGQDGYKEVDFEVGYDRALNERFTVTGGLVRYTFIDTAFSNFTEVYYGVSVAMPGNPVVKVWTDLDSAKGVFVAADFSHAVAMPSVTTDIASRVEFSAGVGFGSPDFGAAYFGVDAAGVSDLHASVAWPVSFGQRVRLTPRVTYSHTPDARYQGSPWGTQHVWSTTLGMTYGF